MKKALFAILSASALCAGAAQYSCLSIITSTKRLGKWTALKAWIESAGIKDEWDKASYVSDDYPQYAQITNAVVSSGILTHAELLQVMAESRDTAVPDDALRRVYNRDVSTSAGRSKWHGKMSRQIVDTNLWLKTTVYEDGTTFVDKARPPSPNKNVAKPAVAMTNGIPARLADARRRWAANKNAGGVTNVTVILRAGK